MATIYEICEAKPTAAAETWHTLASLGISNPMLNYMIAGVDTLTLHVTGQTAFTDDLCFDHNTLVRLRRTVGVASPEYLFLGRVRIPVRGMAGSEEGNTINIHGMWSWFENTVMRQSWTEPNASTITKPRVVLFCNGGGGRMTTGEQIEQCVNVARAAGCPVAAPVSGDIDNGWTPPYDEQINIMISVAISKALVNHPHASIWFDYSTREPRMYCKQRQSLPAVNFDIAGRADIRITARKDQQPPCLTICYEKEYSNDGQTGITTTVDYAPVIPGETPSETNARLSQVDAIWGLYDLQGSSAQTVSQEIEVEELEAAPDSIAWWKAHRPALTDYADADITLSNPQRHGELALPAILTKGALQGWMHKDFENERFTVDAILSRKISGNEIEKKKETLSITLPMTDATSKTYKTTTSYDSGESIPEGIAATMWLEWQQLHYDGSIIVVEQEPTFNALPGQTVNLTNGRAEWASMAAMIKRVSIDIDSGTTSVEFGLPSWIDVDSRVAWFRNTRTRRYSMSRKLRDNTDDYGGGGIQDTAATRDGQTPDVVIRQRMYDPAATNKHELDLNAADFVFKTEADGQTLRIIKPRERLVPYLDPDTGKATAKLAQLLCSDGYGDEHDLGGSSSRPADPTSFVTLGTASEGASDDALTDTYNGAAPPEGKDGVKVFLETRDRFMDAGSKTLYCYGRWLIFPAAIAPTISAEIRIEVDKPQA